MQRLILIALFVSTAAFAVEEKKHEPILVSVAAAPIDIAEVCHRLVSQDMGEKVWHAFIQKAQSRFKDFSREYDTADIKRFLDDRLLQLAPGVKSGKGSSVKEFCSWLALYDLFSEPIPRYIQEISQTDKAWIAEQLADFNWERTAMRIKEKHNGTGSGE